MSLDRHALDAYLHEITPRVLGRRIEKVRPHGKWSLRLELSTRDVLFIDVSRMIAGVWLTTRKDGMPDDPRDVEGPSRTAALLFKKHLEGTRIDELSATPGRILTLRTSRADVQLRPFGAPGATLFLDAHAIAHFGAGDHVLPESDPPVPEAP